MTHERRHHTYGASMPPRTAASLWCCSLGTMRVKRSHSCWYQQVRVEGIGTSSASWQWAVSEEGNTEDVQATAELAGVLTMRYGREAAVKDQVIVSPAPYKAALM